MPNNWKTYKLSEITDVITKGTTPSTYGFGFTDDGVNFIKSESTSYDGRLDENAFVKISEEAHEKLKRSQLKENDILFSMAGAYLGKTGIIHKNHLPANTNQANGIIRVNENKALPKFICFLLRNPSLISYVNASAGQSAQPNINLTDIGNLEFNLPQLEEQQSIASILSAIDDKIENNLAINKTLEEMAMALYKHWFVDFGPFKDGEFVESELGLIPKGWEVKRLDEIAYKRAESYKFKGKEKVVFVNTGDVLEGSFMHNNYMDVDELPGQAKKAIYPEDILFSEIRPANKRFAYVDFDSEDYVVSTKFMVIRNNDLINNKLLYRILTRDETLAEFQNIAESRSGTFPQITFDVIGHIQYALPNIDLQNEFQSIVGNWENQQNINLKENQSLIQLRDTLLPKLISGEVRLKEFREN